MPHFEHEPASAGLQRRGHHLAFHVAKLALMLFVCVATVSFASVFGLTIYQTYFKIPDQVEVPVITGKQMSEANKILDDFGLRLVIQESRYTNTHPDKVVISQDPAAGRKVRKNRQILAVISLGPELVDVPDLKGKTLREARIVLSNSRLRIGKITYQEEKVGEPEQILEQRPGSGEKAAKGKTVDLKVQKGSSSATTTMPNWQGKHVYRIEEKLAQAHLELGSIIWVFDEFVPAGEVVSQQPNRGETVAYRSAVELKVSAGPSRAKRFKQRRLSIAVPQGTRNQRVSVVLNSEVGADRIFEGSSHSGERLELMVAGWQGSEVEVYFNDRLQRREKL